MDHHRAGPERDDPPAPGGILARGGRIEVYTSHWRNRELADLDATIISISRGEPRWRLPFSYRRLRSLAPNDEAWAQEDRRSFEQAYLDQLDALGAEKILEEIRRIAGGRAALLTCWERAGAEYCHRWTLARWIQ